MIEPEAGRSPTWPIATTTSVIPPMLPHSIGRSEVEQPVAERERDALGSLVPFDLERGADPAALVGVDAP